MGEPGRPPAFETPEELQKSINDYFNNGIVKRRIFLKDGTPYEVPVPTITGLCYYIGFESRQSFYDYEKKPGFTYTVKRARLFIEKEYEEQLIVGNTTGAIFALKNMGWIDKQEIDHTTNGKDISTPPISWVDTPEADDQAQQ